MCLSRIKKECKHLFFRKKNCISHVKSTNVKTKYSFFSTGNPFLLAFFIIYDIMQVKIP